MWKNIVDPDRPQMTIWRMCIACCINKAIHTHTHTHTHTFSDCVILITLALQKWLQERALMSRLYAHCLSYLQDAPSSLTLCNTSSFFTRSVQFIFSIILRHHILKLYTSIFMIYVPKCPIFSTIQSCAPSIAFHQFRS